MIVAYQTVSKIIHIHMRHESSLYHIAVSIDKINNIYITMYGMFMSSIYICSI